MSEKPIMYAIPNCNTVKKARAWLDEHGIDYDFHDYKKAGTDPAQLKDWIDEFGWQTIVNTRGMTWRKLDQQIKDTMDAEKALDLMRDKPSIIKRPLLIVADRKLLGYDETAYSEAFS